MTTSSGEKLPFDTTVDAKFLINLWSVPGWGIDSLSRSSTGHLHSPWFVVPFNPDSRNTLDGVASSFCGMLGLSSQSILLTSIEDFGLRVAYYRCGTVRPYKP
jgi:hypothetical protein